jgi:hypothetical protein
MHTRYRARVAVCSLLAVTMLMTLILISPASAGPVANLSRTRIDYGNFPPDDPSEIEPVFVTNVGDAPLTISGTTIAGTNASDFRVAGTCVPPLSLPPNARCQLNFTARAPLGGFGFHLDTATFTLQSDSTPPAADIPLTIYIDHTGKFLPAAASPGWIDFPGQPLASVSDSQTMTILNPGSTTLVIVSIGFVGGNSDDFTISSTCVPGRKFQPGLSCAATIAFQPTANGPRSTELRFVLAALGMQGQQSFSVTGVGGSVAPANTVTAIEYHHASFDHYFITPVAAEIALLDAAQPPFQDWARTGFSFNVYASATAPANSVATCRFFNDHFAPKSSHFYAPIGFGCETTLSMFPDWTLEDAALFRTMLPDGAGACPAGTIPLYRLYNNGMGGAPNHRFVTSLAERQSMLDRGFTPEGNGIGVGMCVPS